MNMEMHLGTTECHVTLTLTSWIHLRMVLVPFLGTDLVFKIIVSGAYLVYALWDESWDDELPHSIIGSL